MPRRLADALESGRPFRIQIAGERIHVPARAEFSLGHERGAHFSWNSISSSSSLAEVASPDGGDDRLADI